MCLQNICNKYTIAGSPSSIAELFSLRSFGYKVGKIEVPSYLLYWTNKDEVVSCGRSLTILMQDFRKLPNYFLVYAEKLCIDLMYGFELNSSIRDLRDDMLNKKLGYSFVPDAENNLDTTYTQFLIYTCSLDKSLYTLSRHGRCLSMP